jgi:hypothetical protein
MTLRGLLLVVAAFSVFGIATVSGEESGPTPTTAPTTETALPTTPGRYSETVDWGVVDFGYAIKAIALLAVAMVVYFLLGLAKHQHDWKPLVLGLFALGFGLLGATIGMIDGCDVLAARGKFADLGVLLYWALRPVATGLIAAMLGGLFTVILSWRNERFREEQASEDKEEVVAQGRG